MSANGTASESREVADKLQSLTTGFSKALHSLRLGTATKNEWLSTGLPEQEQSLVQNEAELHTMGGIEALWILYKRSTEMMKKSENPVAGGTKLSEESQKVVHLVSELTDKHAQDHVRQYLKKARFFGGEPVEDIKFSTLQPRDEQDLRLALHFFRRPRRLNFDSQGLPIDECSHYSKLTDEMDRDLTRLRDCLSAALISEGSENNKIETFQSTRDYA